MPPRSLIHPLPAKIAGPAWLAKGFRPFFLLAALWSVLRIALWGLELRGAIGATGFFPAPFSHAHEMVFGFTLAVLAGFLLTAVGNWTGRDPAVGLPLAGLVALWLSARVGISFPALLPRTLITVLDSSFAPAVALCCAIPIVQTRNYRNLGFVLILFALGAANLATHLGALGMAPIWLSRGHRVAVDLLIAAVIVVTGRIVPGFTSNASKAPGLSRSPRWDLATVAFAVGLTICDALGVEGSLTRGLAAAAAIAGGVRTRGWGYRVASKQPLLWVLHLGHAWVVVGFALRALAGWVYVPATAALHAFTAGAIGMLTIGMMTRVGLGHTGRLLATPRRMGLAFGLVGLSAALRVLAGVVAASWYLPALLVASLLWTVGFSIYLATYWRALVTPRVDGRPG